QEVEPTRLVCVLTSADHAGTRRNPLPAELREAIWRPLLAATGKPFVLVRVNDIPDDARWVEHVRVAVRAASAIELVPDETLVVTANPDFGSYGPAMDASLIQKVGDLLPWVLPGTIVDKGCGTGKLLVELSRRFPGASLVGVDLSRELLRRSDANTYAGGDVRLVLGDAAEAQLPDGSA